MSVCYLLSSKTCLPSRTVYTSISVMRSLSIAALTVRMLAAVSEMDPVTHQAADAAKQSPNGYIRYSDGYGGKTPPMPR